MRFALKTWIGIVMGIAIAIGLANGMAVARDRPATPNHVDLRDCGAFHGAAVLCGAFQITLADIPPLDVEKVRIESQLQEDGVPVPSPFGCYNIKHVGYLPSYPIQSTQNMEPYQCGSYPVGNGQAEFLLTNLKFGTNYCISLRSRRVSDSVVSARWTAPACMRTREMPGIPSKPDVNVTFTSQNGDGGQTLDSVVVAYPYLKIDEQETATIWCNGRQVKYYNGLDHKFETRTLGTGCGDVSRLATASGAGRWLEVKVCKQNFVGENCNSKTFDLSTQAVVPVKLTKIGPTFANSLFVGKWSVSSNLGGAFELDFIQLSAGNLFGEIADGNASDKGTLRGSLTDPLHAQLTIKQPGLNRSGTIVLTVASDGNSLTGSGTVSGDQPVTWQGIKQRPVSH